MTEEESKITLDFGEERFMLVVGDEGTRIVDTTTDEELFAIDITDLLNQQEERIKELEEKNKDLKNYNKWVWHEVKLMGEQLKEGKPFLKIVDDYFIKYGDEETLFNLHKPSDIRSLIYNLNRVNGYSELECEYNRLED